MAIWYPSPLALTTASQGERRDAKDRYPSCCGGRTHNLSAGIRRHPERPVEKKLGEAAGLTQFGVNLTRLKPGAASPHRHWRKNEDEFVFILEGEAVLIEDGGDALRPGDAAGFKAGVATGHQIVNRSAKDAIFLEVGSRADEESVTYADAKVDLKAIKENGRWKASRRDGSPF